MTPEEQPLGEYRPLDEHPAIEASPIPAPPRSPVWGWQDVVIVFSLGLLIIVIAQVLLGFSAKLLRWPVNGPLLAIAAQTIAYPLIFLLLAGVLHMQYGAPFWRSMGWVHSRVSIAFSLLAGVALAFGIGVLGRLLQIPEVDSPVTKLLESRNSAILIAAFGILVAPLAEELAFRGFLQPVLVRRMGVIAGIALTAILFGMLHWEQNSKSWAYAGMISLAGAAFGILRHFSGSTRTSILAHVAYNSTLFLAYFGRESSH